MPPRTPLALLFVTSLTAAAACAPPPPTAPVASHPPPSVADGPAPEARPAKQLTADDLTKMAQREVPPKPKKALPPGALSGEVEAVAAPTVTPEQNEIHLTFSVGTESNIECFVYTNTIDVGSALTGVVRAAMSSNLTPQRVQPTNVVAIGDDVAVFVEAAYTVHKDAGDAFGTLKVMAVSSLATPMTCMHDEVGYSATFERVTTGLASTLKMAKGAPISPKYLSVSIVRVEGHPVGFLKDVEVVGDDGAVVFATISSTLLPHSAVELVSIDQGDTQKWDGHGGVVEMHSMESHDGDLSEDMTIKRVGAREYSYEGAHQGKKVAGRFKTKNPKGLRTEAESHAAVKNLVGSKPEASEVRSERYLASVDPTTPVEVVYRLLSKADRNVLEVVGQNQLKTVVDAQGMASKGEMNLGGATMTLERVVLHGTP